MLVFVSIEISIDCHLWIDNRLDRLHLIRNIRVILILKLTKTSCHLLLLMSLHECNVLKLVCSLIVILLLWAKSWLQVFLHNLCCVLAHLILRICLLIKWILICHLKVVLGYLYKFWKVWPVTYLVYVLILISLKRIVLHLKLILVILNLGFNNFFLLKLFIHNSIIISKNLQITLLYYIWAVKRLSSIPFIP